MVQTIQASELSLYEVEAKLGLTENLAEDFFWEWQQDLPDLMPEEMRLLDSTKADFHDASRYPLMEQAVKLIVLSPILAMAGFYRSPFRILPESSIQIALEDEDEILRGRIDVLVVQDQLWILVIESKEAGFSLKEAIPQALSYMMANPALTKPTYGLCTNGSEFRFLKLVKQPSAQYGFSDLLTLQRRGNDLYEVVKILKRLGQIMLN
jgi:hypothetical protein